VYFEPAAVIVALVLLGQVMELRARSQTSSAIRALLGLAPNQPGGLTTRGAKPMYRSTKSKSATGSVCAPARRCRRMDRDGRPQFHRRIDDQRRAIPVEKLAVQRSQRERSTERADS